MKKKWLSNEALTGLIVVVCLALLGGLIVKVGKFTLVEKGYSVKARFHFTGGVKKHAPVCLSGVSVGEVKNIQILYGDDTTVEVTIQLDEGTQVHTDSQAYVTTLGLMGEKYIEIKAGGTGPLAKEGDLIASKDPVRLEELIELGTKVADDISKMAQDISHLSKTIDGTVSENRPKLGRIFDNLEDTSENFRDFSEDVKWHPWKVLAKGKEKSQEEIFKAREARRAAREQLKAGQAAPPAAPEPAARANNFAKQ